MASEIKVDTISEKTSAGGVTIDGLLIKDGGISGDVSLIGTTPTFTIGDAGTEDAALVFDGNAQDYYIALDDSADDLVIGLGSTIGTTPLLSFTEAGAATFKNVGTGDDNPMVLTLQTAEIDMAANDIIGAIQFQAPDEGTGTDAILVSAAIKAYAEGNHSSSSNATTLGFYTGASEAAAIKMSLSSAGHLDVTGDITGSTINADGDTAAGDNAAIGYTASEGLILTGQGSTDDVTIKNDADTTVLQVATGAANVEITAGNIIMGTSGKGIDFSATADGTTMSSELLDDYEEGNWNPIITDGTNDAVGYSTQAGNYIKIGTLVFLSGNVSASDLGSVGNIGIGGAPFASKAAGEETYYHGSHHIYGTSAAVDETTSLHMGNNVSVIDVYRNITQTTGPHLWTTSDEVDTGTGLRFNMTYISA